MNGCRARAGDLLPRTIARYGQRTRSSFQYRSVGISRNCTTSRLVHFSQPMGSAKSRRRRSYRLLLLHNEVAEIPPYAIDVACLVRSVLGVAANETFSLTSRQPLK